MSQNILHCGAPYETLDSLLIARGVRRLLLVHDASLPYLPMASWADAPHSFELIRFSGFTPNPRYEEVVDGVAAFRAGGCDAVLAVGGGSCMDVAKCIKLYAYMPDGLCWVKEQPVSNTIPLLAMPTTAGTGSEATRFAVIYLNGEKQSVAHADILPDTILLDPALLATLPVYQRKATMLDALCHAVESCWSVNSTEESRRYSADAIRRVLDALPGYMANTPAGNAGMQEAAMTAGQAINITQTTAGHAMCYKLTSLYGFAHGHAAAMCVRRLWPWLLANADRAVDAVWTRAGMQLLADAFGCGSPAEASERFAALVEQLQLEEPVLAGEEELALLVRSVNPVRLKNNPVPMTAEEIRALYLQMMKEY